MAAIELVNTTRLTAPLVRAHASSTFFVPLTAGLMTSISSFGFDAGNGDAICNTYWQSFTALKKDKNQRKKTPVYNLLLIYSLNF